MLGGLKKNGRQCSLLLCPWGMGECPGDTHAITQHLTHVLPISVIEMSRNKVQCRGRWCWLLRYWRGRGLLVGLAELLRILASSALLRYRLVQGWTIQWQHHILSCSLWKAAACSLWHPSWVTCHQGWAGLYPASSIYPGLRMYLPAPWQLTLSFSIPSPYWEKPLQRCVARLLLTCAPTGHPCKALYSTWDACWCLSCITAVPDADRWKFLESRSSRTGSVNVVAGECLWALQRLGLLEWGAGGWQAAHRCLTYAEDIKTVPRCCRCRCCSHSCCCRVPPSLHVAFIMTESMYPDASARAMLCSCFCC